MRTHGYFPKTGLAMRPENGYNNPVVQLLLLCWVVISLVQGRRVFAHPAACPQFYVSIDYFILCPLELQEFFMIWRISIKPAGLLPGFWFKHGTSSITERSEPPIRSRTAHGCLRDKSLARCSEYVVTTVQVFTIGGCLLPADIPLWFHYNLSWGIVKGRLCAKVFLLQP